MSEYHNKYYHTCSVCLRVWMHPGCVAKGENTTCPTCYETTRNVRCPYSTGGGKKPFEWQYRNEFSDWVKEVREEASVGG